MFYFYTKNMPDSKDPVGVLSQDYNALSAMRDKDIAAEDFSNPSNPSAYSMPTQYTISTVELTDALQREAEARMSRGFGTCTMRGDGLFTVSSDVRIGRDILHEPSEMVDSHVAAILMGQRQRDLTPLWEIADKTPAYHMPAITDDTRRSFAICYGGVQHGHPYLDHAIRTMAQFRLDTAASVTEFLKRYDNTYESIRNEHSDIGPNQCAAEAAVATALYFQKEKCSTDLLLQSMYAQMASDYKNDVPRAIEADGQLRHDAIMIADQQVTDHLRNNGQYLNDRTQRNFRDSVLKTIANERWNKGDSIGVISQQAIKDVATAFEQAARTMGNVKAAFCLANIANAAEELSQSTDSRDETDLADPAER